MLSSPDESTAKPQRIASLDFNSIDVIGKYCLYEYSHLNMVEYSMPELSWPLTVYFLVGHNIMSLPYALHLANLINFGRVLHLSLADFQQVLE